MANEYAPDDFDWVAAQAKCRAAAMFATLQESITADVERRNELSDEGDASRFEVSGEEGTFEVLRTLPSPFGGSNVEASVTFVRAGRRIHVRGDRVDVDFTAVLALDPTGACRFVVGEAVYMEWEIRRMALEELFFDHEDDEAADE